MTEEAGERRAAFPQLRGIVPDAVLEWPHLRVVAWSAFFFLVALAVLWVSRIDLVHFPDGRLKPESTPYINHESQANSFLHGHLDLTKELSGFITEPALYNGKEFCIPPPDKAPGVGSGITLTPDPNCKMYLQHSPGPALMLLPGVAIFGLEMNQTLVSIVLAAITAPIVFLVVRKLVENEATQVWLTVLFLFGTIFWFTAANGGVWYFSHTAALLFLFAALYTTFVRRNAFLTGAFVGAAFLCRPRTVPP